MLPTSGTRIHPKGLQSPLEGRTPHRETGRIKAPFAGTICSTSFLKLLLFEHGREAHSPECVEGKFSEVELPLSRFLRTSGVLIRGIGSIVTFGACEWEGPPGSIREHGRARHISWEDPDDHQEMPGTCGPRRRGRFTVLRLIRAAAPGRRGRVDPVRRPPPDAAAGDA